MSMLEQVQQAERNGQWSRLHKYAKPLGAWIWKQKLRWKKLTVEERIELSKLQSFAECREPTYDAEIAEWNRMFHLCEEFEAKHQTCICFKQIYLGNPIGRWLTEVRHKCVMKDSKATAAKSFWERLQTLRTIQRWDVERKITDLEQSQRKWNSMMDQINRRFKPYPKSSPTAYEILEVQPGASINVIKAAYRALCLKHHPDHGGDPKKFIEIKAAFDQLNSQ